MEVTNLSLPFGVIIIKFNAFVGNTIDVIGKDIGFIKQGINFLIINHLALLLTLHPSYQQYYVVATTTFIP
jgi:hypothetical protein